MESDTSHGTRAACVPFTLTECGSVNVKGTAGSGDKWARAGIASCGAFAPSVALGLKRSVWRVAMTGT